MRVLVVEDHPAMRFALCTAVDLSGVGEVAGECGSAGEAMAVIRSRPVDLVVLDLRLNGETSGIELCREVKSLPDPPLVLVCTSYNSPAELKGCVLAGADGYVHKSVEYQELVEAIRKTAAGEDVRLIGAGTLAAEPRLADFKDTASLTSREEQVLSLMLRGYSNPDIAQELYVSLPTVKTHVSNILKKLGLKSRWELFY